METYYHGSPESEIIPNNDGVFGQFLFFSSTKSATDSYGDFIHTVTGDFSVLDSHHIAYEFDKDGIKKYSEIISGIYGVTEDQAFDLLTLEIDEWDEDLDIDNETRGELSWDVQRYQAEIAIDNGYDGLSLRDEHGKVYMFPAKIIAK